MWMSVTRRAWLWTSSTCEHWFYASRRSRCHLKLLSGASIMEREIRNLRCYGNDRRRERFHFILFRTMGLGRRNTNVVPRKWSSDLSRPGASCLLYERPFTFHFKKACMKLHVFQQHFPVIPARHGVEKNWLNVSLCLLISGDCEILIWLRSNSDQSVTKCNESIITLTLSISSLHHWTECCCVF